ncbi:Oidioi.mRNA.OKI2018_I69.XSR.g14573.t1.cds [Oikopleura dioica]|uniref:Oidioi.mRNA.OKI2018_I69.XSR.g14573.t1.cds n=1 Tax=Oikopleura dioica TaxID=34765 RepID=A0ABN7SF68_OIKDI|nr:Oidioi.mRNA.OKI2018_I69.XSR.g14573.t1.cds [Oikopleura dioica]
MFLSSLVKRRGTQGHSFPSERTVSYEQRRTPTTTKKNRGPKMLNPYEVKLSPWRRLWVTIRSHESSQIIMASTMTLTIFSMMSLIWTSVTVIPWYVSRDYAEDSCKLVSIQGWPKRCEIPRNSSHLIGNQSRKCSEHICLQVHVSSANSSDHIILGDELELAGLCQPNCTKAFAGRTKCKTFLSETLPMVKQITDTPSFTCYTSFLESKYALKNKIYKKPFPWRVIFSIVIPVSGTVCGVGGMLIFICQNRGSLLSLTKL